MKEDEISKLLEIPYKFYPREICAMLNKLEYSASSEYNSLLNKIEENSFDINQFKLDLEKFSNKKVYDFSLLSWHDRAFNLQFVLGSNNDRLFVFCINISVVIPYYICYILELDRDLERKILKSVPKRNFDLEKGLFEKELIMKKNFINTNTNLREFPEKLLYKVVPDINFQDIEMGKFTFFNAFFLNEYHTRLF